MADRDQLPRTSASPDEPRRSPGGAPPSHPSLERPLRLTSWQDALAKLEAVSPETAEALDREPPPRDSVGAADRAYVTRSLRPGEEELRPEDEPPPAPELPPASPPSPQGTSPMAAPPAPEPPHPAAPPGGAAVAVLVCHGMGQQVPFETLHLIADAVWTAHHESLAPGRPVPPMSPADVRVRYVAFGDDQVPRAELTLRRGVHTRDVHFFEMYWAPFTEGKVTALDVVNFLLGAGRRGIPASLRNTFTRWMFGDWQVFPLGVAGLFQIAVAVAVVAGLVLVYFLGWVFSAAQVYAVVRHPDTRTLVLPILARAIAWTLGAVVAVGVVGLATALVPSDTEKGTRGWSALVVNAAAAVAAVLALAVWTVWLAALLSCQPGRWGLGAFIVAHHGCLAHPVRPPVAALLVFLLAAMLVGNVLRYFLVQYVGDVTAYVSAHTSSKFYDVRQRIQDVGRRLALNVYSTRGPVPATTGPSTYAYSTVLVVGHSLGSVIAYDLLNYVINQDRLLRSAGVSPYGVPLDAAGRTKLLLTFGSPLDKTAFFFRTQQDAYAVREALAAAAQPMIARYAFRPRAWINIWSPRDWISGSLEFYDRPRPPRTAGGARLVPVGSVYNVRDPEAAFDPGRAHTGYWSHRAMREKLYRYVWA